MGGHCFINLTLVAILLPFFHLSNGCWMEGITNWQLVERIEIKDTFRGVMFERATENITAMTGEAYDSDNLNGGPYWKASFSNSKFIIETNENFNNYEEHETADSSGLTVYFSCVGRQDLLVFTINVIDTNNNDPVFRPSNEYEFTLTPPLAPGYRVTDCINDIIVRDIDLTTQRINYVLTGSPDFEISSDTSSTAAKEFKAVLRTSTFIRSIPKLIELRISATDVDLTGDPRRTTYATVRIKGSGSFELPDDLIFTQTFYISNYSRDNTITLQQPISLQRGYDEQVKFSLDTDSQYSQYFEVVQSGNRVNLLATPLPGEVLTEQKLFLVIRADRENTSGTSATIIVLLPELVKLGFQQPNYNGKIVDNVLQLNELILTQGYDDETVSVEIINDYSSYFVSSIQGNKISLTMSPLASNIIEENTFLNLQVIASTNRSTASSIVTLEIIKDDSTTPLFERAKYVGSYKVAEGLTLDEIVLTQGYDNTVQISIKGEHANYFQIIQSGPRIVLNATTISTELFREHNILLTVEATKPRTVGANTAVSISLPPETQLQFEQSIYNGVIKDNSLQISDLLLSQGYEDELVIVTIQSDYSSYFRSSIQDNRITLIMSPLAPNIIEENTFLNLQVLASTNRSSASSIVTLEIIKDDSTTPVFEQATYVGSYEVVEGLTLDEIVITQGYDSTVQISLKGEHANYFQISQSGPRIILNATTIPTDLFREHNILLTVEATKPRTVGANTAVSISLPPETELQFEQSIYDGIIEDNRLQISDLFLSQGYNDELVTVTIQSDYSSYFVSSIQDNIITLTMSPLAPNIIEENTFLNLQVIASTNRSTASSIVTLEIIKDDSTTPVFEQATYVGIYKVVEGLMLDEILITQGYDSTVQITLKGEYANYFQVSQSGPRIVLNATTIPTELFREHNILLTVEATKPRTVGANTAVSISLPPEIQLEFEQSIYNGVIEDNSLQISNLYLSQGYNDEVVTVTIQSDYASYFSAVIQENRIRLNMLPLESNIIEVNSFLTLLVVASTNRSSTSTVVTLEIIKDDSTTPKFERNVYSGSYDPTDGLTLDQIVIIQGYDNSVQVSLTGEYASYFQIIKSGEFINLTSSSIPLELFSKHQLLLSIEARKPRTVGANTAITIALPPARNLRFAADSYTGTVKNNTVNIEKILLYTGYDDDVVFKLSGNYGSYFILSTVQNLVSVDLVEPLPDSVITENNFLHLILTASASHAVTTTTYILFEIIKEDVTTPLFSQSIYYATYEGTSMEINNITLRQGYDDTVSFQLNGEYAQYFVITNNNNNIVLTVKTSIPEEVIFNEKVLLFYLTAEKPLTVGANAAVRINFPLELTEPAAMTFSQNTYIGSLDQKYGLILDDLVLDTGYALGTEFALTGEHAAYFALTSENNIVSITVNYPLPSDVLHKKFVTLEVEARRARAVSVSTTIIIDVLQPVVVPPVFDEAFYRGVYTKENGLQIKQEISLSQGFDETVVFLLEGDFADWFILSVYPNSVTIIVKDIPEAIIEENNHLVLAVIATKLGAVEARTVLVIDLPKETPLSTILRFAHPSYVGQIKNDTLELPPVTLVGIYDMPINLNFSGEYASFFHLTLQSNTVSVELVDSLPSNIAEDNKFIILNLEASYPEAISGFATIILELNDVRSLVETPVFEEAYYIGQYSELVGFDFEHTIRLTQGFDETISFILAGEDAKAFNLIENSPNNLTLSVNDEIIQQVNNRGQLIFSIVANNGVNEGKTAIIVTLTDTSSEQRLRFEQDYYQGSLENNNLSLNSIKLVEGFSMEVSFSLKGVYAEFFQLLQQNETLNLRMTSPLTQEMIDNLRTIIMTLEAENENIKTSTAIIIDVIKSDDLILLDFDESYYIGSYTALNGLVFDRTITLAEGYDQSVEFSLQGENSQWFAIRSEQNAIRLTLSSPIPPAVLANNQQLLFTVVAERPGSRAAMTTIVIQLTEEVTENQILGFDRTSYVGSVVNNTVQLTPIVLREGYTSNVTFQLYGDFAKYFALQSQDATVTVSLAENIPEDTLPSNRIIILDIEATAPQTLSAFAAIVFEVILDEDKPNTVVELAFEETYYIGSYTALNGLVFDRTITLAEGYDQSVEFSLQGENSQWFAIRSEQNAIRLTLSSPIPPAVLANNQQLLFTVVAERPGSRAAMATIVIQLTEEVTENQILGFDRTSYVGSVVNNTVQLTPIVLREGYTSNVTFQLYGDFAKYFALQSQDATVTVSLAENIPEDTLPSNRIIILDIEATAPQTLSAFAAIVFEVILDEDKPNTVVELAFEETYYIGSYTALNGLVFDRTMTLAEGYDQSVEFSLQGENSQWFAIRSEQNAIRLTLSSPIPAAVLANNQQLLFTVVAERPGSRAAMATIVIQLTEEVTENQILGFDRTSYVGSVVNNTVQLTPIVLREGYTSNVTFQLYGDFAKYFALQSQDATVTVSLAENIPEDTLPSNRIILLDIEATAPQTLSAFAAIVFEVILDEDKPNTVVELAFEETYYIGSYTALNGLVFDRTITLAEGYDQSVEFSLQGENSQWFAIRSEQNAIRLTLSSPIPAAVLANNQQLLFTVVAERPGSRAAMATIVIQLTEEVTENQILGFDRTSYVGSVVNNTVQLTPIVLREGYTSNVTFQLYGDFAKYFALQSQDATVTVSLAENIPEDTLPSNRIILLDIEATAPQTLSAFAAIVFEVILDEDKPNTVVELAFEETYYIGSYTALNGLVFDRTITLAEGYDQSVEFSLQGENSQWFAIRSEQNAIRLTLSSPIPAAVLANNQQLLFTVVAERPGSRAAMATIVIQLTEEVTENQILGFDRTSYVGSVVNNTVQLTPIVLREGYTSNVTFQLYGDFAKYFALQSQDATVTVSLAENIPEDTLPSNRIILLDIEATAPQTLSAFAAIVFEVILDEDKPNTVVELAFEETYYIGSYTALNGLVFDRTITLAEGYDQSVEFSLQGENSQWFAIRSEQNAIRLTLSSPIPAAVLANNQQLLFTVVAERPGSRAAMATIVIQLTEEVTENQILGFDRTSYVGSVVNNTVQLTPIVLREGYTSNVTFQLYGDFAKYFALQSQDATVTVSLAENIPEDTLPSNRIILLDIEATAPQTLSAFAAIVFEVILDEDKPNTVVELAFEETYYIGSYTALNGLVFDRMITLAEGYDQSVEFSLQGENSQWFAIRSEQNAIRLTLSSPIPAAVLANNQQLLFTVVAERPGSRAAMATIVIQLTEEVTENQILGFDRTSYVGSVVNNTVQLTPIVLREGYTSNVTFQLYGDFAKYFALQSQEATVTVSLAENIPEDTLPSNRIILLDIVASAPQTLSTFATIVFEVILDEDESSNASELAFEEMYYIGSYTSSNQLVFNHTISLAKGYDETVAFYLQGESSKWFDISRMENSVQLTLSRPIPPDVVNDNTQLIFAISAQKPGITATTTIVIQLEQDTETGPVVAFDKVLYEGIVQDRTLQYETITLSGYEGTEIDIFGVYAALFSARVVDGVVNVQVSHAVPADVNNVILELRAGNAGAVLILQVLNTGEVPDIPTVTFSASSYVIRVEKGQTGQVGTVRATADNGEALTYSLRIDDDHLQARLSVSSTGELRLSAPADSGVYNFEVSATTIATRANATAPIRLTVEEVSPCGDDEIVTAPLIVIDRDEEQPHINLVTLDPEHSGCRYSLTNKWPANQNWLYVDETGLHTRAIDREDPSIAFMALSQVQVELTLHCDSDATRIKRSADARLDWLGPYDYGTNTWVLGDSITFNPRRSIVNLIVNDINDNAPVFVGKENEPIVVGYPIKDLETSILPRSLTELQATDADVGENAVLLYWSSQPELAVSPTTGYVHVKNNVKLENNMLLTVNATDRNGNGLTGSISLMVKLLDTTKIAVVTVRNAFLEDESRVLGNLSNVLGYDVRPLRSVVISDQSEQQVRVKRDTDDTTGSSLQIYVYGLIESEPISVDRLASDINDAAIVTVDIASIQSLEDHLEGQAICDVAGRDTGLLAATIVLSILLFILIVAIVVWFLLTREKAKNYDQFSDTNSIASQIESPSPNPKPEAPMPRLNIEELKRSERRLQDMLNAPIDEVKVEPTTSSIVNPVPKIPSTDSMAPIVIQDKLKDAQEYTDDEDEFGERKGPRKKSVVTFNENVEKIIPVEDPGQEVYKL